MQTQSVNAEKEKKKISELKRGDIFKWNESDFEKQRFHSYDIIDGRYVISLISMDYLGDIFKKENCANAFTWRNEDVLVIMCKE